MRLPALVLVLLVLAGCTPMSISQARMARPLLNETTVGGYGYPIIVEGAENVGSNPALIAQNLRFPAYLGAGTSFRAITPAEAPPTHAHLAIQPGQTLAPSTLTFVHGTRRIGMGTFSIPPGSYNDPQALGAVSALILTT